MRLPVERCGLRPAGCENPLRDEGFVTFELELFIEAIEQLVVLLINPVVNLIVRWVTAMLLDHGLR